MIDHRQIIRRLQVMNIGDIEGATALVGGILLPVEVRLHGLRVERRAVMELDAGPQLEGPGLEVVGMGPGQRQLRLRLALVVERRQRIENRRRRGLRRGVVHANLERIKTGNVEFEPDREIAALLLGTRRDRPIIRSQIPSQGISAQARASGMPLSWSVLPIAFRPVFRIVASSRISMAGNARAGKTQDADAGLGGDGVSFRATATSKSWLSGSAPRSRSRPNWTRCSTSIRAAAERPSGSRVTTFNSR